MIKLRLQRRGRKKRPFYHIVVADSRFPRDGRIIERLGRFDNTSENKQLTYDEERVIHWMKIGAQPSDTVRSILKKEGILYKLHLMRWGKSDEEIEAALEEWRAAREAKQSDEDLSKKEKQKAQLKAEEKEYKKQLEEKAAAAAKELERKKAEEAKAKEEAEKAAQEEEAEAKAEEVEEPSEEKAEAKPEEAAKKEEPEADSKDESDEKAESKADTAEDDDKKEVKTEETEEVKEEPEAKTEEPAEEKEEPKAEAKKEEAEPAEEKADAKEKEPKKDDSPLSTDMNANEAIDLIKEKDLDELEGFVPEDEDRVTVLRAWESKKEE